MSFQTTGQELIETDSIEYFGYDEEGYEIPLELDEDTSIETPTTNIEDYPASPSEKVWQDEKWNEVKKEYTYTPDEKEKEEEEEEEEEFPMDEHSSSSIIDSLNEFFTSPLGKMLAIVIAASLLIFLIVKLISGKPIIANKKIKPLVEIDLENPDELPEEDTLERLLRIALERKDYKTAVRILYLSIIRQLAESKYIMWQKDKTNRDYLNEMRQRSHYRSFRDLTLVYEVIWYGDKEIADPDYQRVSQLFSNYQSSLNGSTKEN
ncbi:MAG: DUF4129 domain-containing protein [Flavobacteriales bacterium]|nr:DUF4129 domain-containing protein [Flavobacteriales bacterium]